MKNFDDCIIAINVWLYIHYQQINVVLKLGYIHASIQSYNDMI